MSMPWFKHYNNASTSLSIQTMMIELGVIGYAYYFLLLELLCSKFDGTSCVIDLTISEVAVKLRIKSGRVEVILKSFSTSNLVTSESLGVIVRINAPILLELKSKDFARARQESVGEAELTLLRKRLKNKNKNKKQDADDEFEKGLESVYKSYSFTEGYPRNIFEEFAFEAYPIYLASNKPDKQWLNFLTYYVKNNKPKIQERMRQKNYDDLDFAEIHRSVFASEDS